MQAIIYTHYGGPEVLELKEIPTPSPKDDEVLIRVRAASINDWDFGLLRGDAINRTMNGFRKPRRQILGSDISGTVEEVRKNVRGLRVGDEVYGDLSGRWGGFAEYCCAPEKMLAIKPPKMSFEQAAAIPQAGMLAVQGLIDVGKLKRNQQILINGAGGGVGTLGLQIAKTFNAHVTGVDSSIKLDMMRQLGFDEVLDYRQTDFTRTGKQYDLVLDVKTNRSVFDYTRVLKPGGSYVTVGGSIPRLLQALLMAPLVRFTNKKKIRIVSLKPNKDLNYINELFMQGKLSPVMEQPFTLENFAEAFRIYDKAEQLGKLVIVF